MYSNIANLMYVFIASDKELLKKTSELAELQEVYESRMLQMKVSSEFLRRTCISPSHLLDLLTPMLLALALRVVQTSLDLSIYLAAPSCQ